VSGPEVSVRLATRRVATDLVEELHIGLQSVPSVVGALLMGSHSRGIAHAKSNVDVQLVVDRLDSATAEVIGGRRDKLQKRLGVPLSINVHTLADAHPSLGRHDLFSGYPQLNVVAC
jgi:predicted nucleotidyltransferase